MASTPALSDSAVAGASGLLVAHLRNGTKTAGLPDDLRPRTRADGYRIQAGLEAVSRHPRFGWKIAATNAGGQRTLGVDGPLAGRLIREMTVGSGGSVSLSGNLMRVAEVEFAFRMGRDLPPRAEPYREDEVMDRVADLVLAIEIPDTRLDPLGEAGAPQVIADNACSGWLVVGPEAPAGWREADLASLVVRAEVNGALAAEGSGAVVLGGPATALTWLANEVTGLGLTLRAGELVSTGSAVRPVPIAAGDHVTGDFGRYGRVEARLA